MSKVMAACLALGSVSGSQVFDMKQEIALVERCSAFKDRVPDSFVDLNSMSSTGLYYDGRFYFGSNQLVKVSVAEDQSKEF